MLLFIVLVELFKHPGIFSTLFTADNQQVIEVSDQKVTGELARVCKAIFYRSLELARLLV